MPTRPFTITPRRNGHHHLDGQGGGRTSHTRHINGRLYFFEHFWDAPGTALYRVRTLVPNPVPGIAEGWQTIHEFTSNQATSATPASTTRNSVMQRAYACARRGLSKLAKSRLLSPGKGPF